ncbi:unnamed protein product [Brassica rapa subsp. trilocularis]
MKQYKEVGVLGLSMKVSLEKGALVSSVGLFSLWSFALGVLVLAWYREWWVQSAGSSMIFGLTAILLLKDCLQIHIYDHKVYLSDCCTGCMCCLLFGLEVPLYGL